MSRTILVVDDMAIFREPIAAALRSKGYQTLCAGNGKEALATLDGQVGLPDLILLDIAMPEMDGLSFLRALRANERTRNLPVILLTAVKERDYVVQAGKLGIRDFLLKSQFSLKEMLERIARKLEPVPASVSQDGAEPGDPSQATDAERDEQDSQTDFADAQPKPAVESLRNDMSASQVVDLIENSEELREILKQNAPPRTP